jgi:ubiquinone/menaquinone biosynthesis C-methylase UbiE
VAIATKWPKTLPVWTPDQAAIADDFMRYWHEQVLHQRYGAVERFNHEYVVRHAPREFSSTLEIGAGLGDHIKYERMSAAQTAQYTALELRDNMAAAIKERFPAVRTLVGNVEHGLDLPDGAFDRVVAIHVLEHLPDLPRALGEIHRLLDKQRGVFSVVIPCEGGLGYALARAVSSARIFRRRYGQSYRWFIEREHINSAREVVSELRARFVVRHRSFFPLGLPLMDANLCLGLTLAPRT